MTENEQLKAQTSEYDGTALTLHQRLDEELNKQKLKFQKEILAHKNSHAYELEDKDKRVSELQNETALMKRQHDERLLRVQAELDEFKEHLAQMKKNEALLEVYKKKLDAMGDVRIELKDAQKHNQKLHNDIEMLQKETEKTASLEKLATKRQLELGKVKQVCDQKDLIIQEVNFQLRDSESRIKELDQKQSFYKAQIDKLMAETTTAQEELMLMKRETESNARADTDKAEIKDNYNTIVMENKQLKRQAQQKFSTEKFETDQELQDAKGKLTLAEAKNNQF